LPGLATAQTDDSALKRFETAKHLVVMIEGQLGSDATSGAGIIFGYEGGQLYIATANHVVRRGALTATDLRVQLRMLPGEKLVAELMPQTQTGLDLAVLRVSGVKAPALAKFPFRLLGDAAVLRRQAQVYHVGFSGGRPWRTNVTADRFAERMDDALFFESMTVLPGDSGGGLFDARWELMGMVIIDDPPEGRALDIGRILEQVRQWGFPVSLRYTVFHATKIAFTRYEDIYIMNPDGTGVTRVTNNQPANRYIVHRPVWSPDGKSIAFTWAQEIYRIGVDGTNLVNLTNHPAEDVDPCWSPDGRKIAFQSNRSGRWEIYATNADGTKPLALTRGTPAGVEYKSHLWSPDSKKLAFELYREGSPRASYEFHVVNADGTNQQRLVRDASYGWSDTRSPAWSPDGKRIAFVTEHDESTNSKSITVMNADGSNSVKLIKPRVLYYYLQDLSWSPDGTKILFRGSDAGGQPGICVITVDGAKLTQLTESWADDPVWSPDGTMIAFLHSPSYRESADRNDVCVMNADGTEQVCMPPKSERGFYTRNLFPSWSPFFR